MESIKGKVKIKNNIPAIIIVGIVLAGLTWYAISNQGQAVKAINKLA